MAFEDEKDPYCTSDRFATKNGMKVVELGEDSATATMTIDESFLNGIGIPMCGCYFTLGDYSFGAACHYIKNEIVTLNSQIDFIASAQLGDTVYARCHCVSATRRTMRYEVEMTDQNGKLLALMHVTGYRKGHKK